MQAVKEASRPASPSVVRSFLALVSFIFKFIADFATIAQPLKTLLEMGLNLSEKKQKNPRWPTLTRVRADASLVGFGAVLS